jgi:MPBQ/MSBQ methyltransferase
MLNFLYSEWTHPFFISISDYKKLMESTEVLNDIITDDWTPQTIASWLHSIWAGVFDPWPVFSRPHLWWKTFRDGLTLVRMHKSFDSKLMEYGMMAAVKSNRRPFVG